MGKVSNRQSFKFKTQKGQELIINCHTYDNYSGWGHRATLNLGNNIIISKYQTWYNRSYESFTYETVIIKVLRALYNKKSQKNDLDYIMQQVQDIREKEKVDALAFCESFTKKYNALSDDTKKSLEQKDICVNTVAQGEALINCALILDALKN